MQRRPSQTQNSSKKRQLGSLISGRSKVRVTPFSITTQHGLGDFNVTNKSNKLPSFIYKYWRFSKALIEEKT